VWRWNRRFSPVEFIQDPADLVPPQPDWLVYLPPTHPLADRSNLYAIEGGRPYLVRLADGSAPVPWSVRGRPVVPRPSWITDSLNFFGFNVSGLGPSFADLFDGSVAHANNPVYQLSEAGRWMQVTTPYTTRQQSGEAIWVRATTASEWSGPIRAVLEQTGRLDFGRALQEQTVRFRNESARTQIYSVRLLASEPPPGTSEPALAGDVAMDYWFYDPSSTDAGWAAFSGTVNSPALNPGQELVLRLAVRRRDMPPVPVPADFSSAAYQSVLEVVSSPGNSRLLIPVTCEGLDDASLTSVAPAGSGPLARMGPGDEVTHAGLWVGNAVINQVGHPSSGSDAPEDAATEFGFPLLVHVDSAGQAHLLQQVVEMWKDGTYKPDPEDSSKLVVDQPGRYVLVTDRSLLSSFQGSTLRDGRRVGRRFSSAAFAFSEPIDLSGGGGFLAGQFACTVTLDFDDPLNPFKHAFHPDHNNLDERFETQVAEAFTVSRTLQLQFSATDPDGLAIPGWGDDQVGGAYEETITGLLSEPVKIAGIFRLQRVSFVSVLNDISVTSTSLR
jgi:hypothetical protein